MTLAIILTPIPTILFHFINIYFHLEEALLIAALHTLSEGLVHRCTVAQQRLPVSCP